MKSIPDLRIRTLNEPDVRTDGDYVLYWMIAYRRTTWNFSLQRAADWARELGKPLVILEALRCGYPWASDRFHQFVLQGMAENARRLEKKPVTYYPYVEPSPGKGKGLLKALGKQACVVVTDDFPAFMLPRMMNAAGRQLKVRLEAVDSNGILPMRSADKVFPTAFIFRRFLQKNLMDHLGDGPKPDPLKGLHLPVCRRLPPVARRWPRSSTKQLDRLAEDPGSLPIDHSVPAAPVTGGALAAVRAWRRFLREGLDRYDERRNQPDDDATSGMSAYLHFGHISVHQLFKELMEKEDWTPASLGEKAAGKRSGWWGVSASAEGFLDQVLTWRELGFNMCWQRDDYDRFESLPDWVLKTLEDHAGDKRAHTYSLRKFETAATHDPLWNAAQTQLAREGRLHNYLRMLWGKKILEWSTSPRQALSIMIELNNKYALDGRDPNSYSGIFWVLGRYDRPWFPERPIFGTVRCMSSANTARKVRVREYLERYAPEGKNQLRG
jgi:deoxyribodipyrimidine photo-lyase